MKTMRGTFDEEAELDEGAELDEDAGLCAALHDLMRPRHPSEQVAGIA
ncbi:hypothetical protein ACWD4K_17935 [Streptomyces gelaticus]